MYLAPQNTYFYSMIINSVFNMNTWATSVLKKRFLDLRYIFTELATPNYMQKDTLTIIFSIWIICVSKVEGSKEIEYSKQNIL